MRMKFIWIPLCILGIGLLMTAAVMLLWNWLMPAIFGLDVITFWQALGILVLSKILFGAHWGRKHHCCGHAGGHYGWKQKFKSKWQNMSDEDKKKWEEKFGGYCRSAEGEKV